MNTLQRIILSGGPGAGKTTVLDALSAYGLTVVPESARAIIRERLGRGLRPRPSPRQFAKEVLQRDRANYDRTSCERSPVLFDRGILDALCMFDQAKPLNEKQLAAMVSRYPYRRQVFFFPPWEAIYRNDAERDQTFAQATHVFETLRAWYSRCGYDIMEVPQASVAARCTFILDSIGSG